MSEQQDASVLLEHDRTAQDRATTRPCISFSAVVSLSGVNTASGAPNAGRHLGMPGCNLYSMRCNSTANVGLRMHAPVIFEAGLLVTAGSSPALLVAKSRGHT